MRRFLIAVPLNESGLACTQLKTIVNIVAKIAVLIKEKLTFMKALNSIDTNNNPWDIIDNSFNFNLVVK